MTNSIVMQNVVKNVSTNNGTVFTRTSIAFGPNPATDFDSVRDGEKAQATFSGGNGLSVTNAVVITASNEENGCRAAYIWLHEQYHSSRLQEEGSDFDDSGKQYEEIKLITIDGKSRTIFFDITSFFGR